jgi:two-component system phosphate regulon sensor histidine kinase PhoR
MEPKIYKFILFIIIANVLATIGMQVFWNIKNYKENKTQLIKDVQTAFDNSIEYYYVEDSKNDFLAFVSENTSVSDPNFIEKAQLDTVFNKKGLLSNKPKNSSDIASLGKNYDSTASGINTVGIQTIEITTHYEEVLNPKSEFVELKKAMRSMLDGNIDSIAKIKVLRGKKASDSISKLKNLVNKIIISVAKDSLEFTKISKALDKELLRTNIDVAYSFQHFKADTLFAQFKKDGVSVLPLSAISGTTYLPSGQKMQISFSDPTVLILKRSFVGIFLSVLLMLSVFSCLMFLLQIINRQKKIDEIKNDLISNITHEFKTPITTISTAIEGIKNFNELDDKEKTNRYLDISRQQLEKLEIMVEKLLETASLNTNNLHLNKEEVNIAELIKSTIEKHQMTSEKAICYSSGNEIINCEIDVFHFENAISNLIDNALKYGGKNCSISVVKKANRIEIAVEDDGLGIDKTQGEKIFEQFYRIPKGNIHDVKGFGIGLYYAKKIIEKHGGTLELVPNVATTIFKITLTNA